jgi:hypothetical protein
MDDVAVNTRVFAMSIGHYAGLTEERIDQNRSMTLINSVGQVGERENETDSCDTN